MTRLFDVVTVCVAQVFSALKTAVFLVSSSCYLIRKDPRIVALSIPDRVFVINFPLQFQRHAEMHDAVDIVNSGVNV